MSRNAVRIVIVSLLGALAVAIACGVITVRSQRTIEIAQTPATTQYVGETEDFPTVTIRKRIPTTGPTVTVAVIGGMSFTGFWNDLAERYEKQRGVYVQMIATGEKNDIAAVFRQGGVDVITMHASDTVINLVADGYAIDPQPWMRNDLIIVGPHDDPAGIRGMKDVATALKKIAAAKSPFVVHSSLGSQEVLLSILDLNQIVLDPAQTSILFDDKQRSVLLVAAQKHAYTLVGRIPFKIGRLPNNGLELMVQGDQRLRRPYIVAIANPAKVTGTHLAEGKKFAEYLRQSDTQQWIANYGRGLIDDGPLFFPVSNRFD